MPNESERRCERCQRVCQFRRQRCRQCWWLLCIFCAKAPCENGAHRGNRVIMDAIRTARPTEPTP